MSCSIRSAALALLLSSLPFLLPPALGATEQFVFADGKIVCEISSAQSALPEQIRATLPIAMNAALEHVGVPAEPARLAVRLQAPPSFYKRAKALFRAEAFAVQEGDEIRLHAGKDPLKLAFRLGHELSHWLAYKRHGPAPPSGWTKGWPSSSGRPPPRPAHAPSSKRWIVPFLPNLPTICSASAS